MGPGPHLRAWVYSGAHAAVIVAAMKAVLAATALFLLLPATASAATATVTGDDGNPVALTTSAPVQIRNMDVQADVVVGSSEAPYYTSRAKIRFNGTFTKRFRVRKP